MNLKVPLSWELYRQHLPGYVGGDRGNGHFVLPAGDGHAGPMIVVVSNGGGWEHASVSLKGRCPTWEEMSWVKEKLWGGSETVMQLHVPQTDHRNFHPTCLHLWKPLKRGIPRPPGIFVAPEEMRDDRVTADGIDCAGDRGVGGVGGTAGAGDT